MSGDRDAEGVGAGDPLRVVPTDAPPSGACRRKGSFTPSLTLMGNTTLCRAAANHSRCGRSSRSIGPSGQAQRAIGVVRDLAATRR
ncbi:MAG: hypothetical protein R3E53_07905 [Myxococcota bacterium]